MRGHSCATAKEISVSATSVRAKSSKEKGTSRSFLGKFTLVLLGLCCLVSSCGHKDTEIPSSSSLDTVTEETPHITRGSVKISNGVLYLGTGYGIVTVQVGESMRLLDRAYEEKEDTTLVAVDDSSAILRFGLMRSLTQTISSQDFAQLLRSQGAPQAQALPVDKLGNAEAAGAYITDAQGVTSTMYAVRIHGETWLVTVKADTESKRQLLLTMADTLHVEAMVTSGGGVGAGLKNAEEDQETNANQETGHPTRESHTSPGTSLEEEKRSTVKTASRDGKLVGILDASGYTLTTPEGKLHFSSEDLRVISRGQGDFVGVQSNSVSLLFTSATRSDFLSGNALADALIQQNQGNVASSGLVTRESIAGFPSVGAYVKLIDGGATYFFVIRMGETYLAVVVESADEINHPAESMLKLLDEAHGNS